MHQTAFDRTPISNSSPVVLQILSKLPIKSLFRSKTVCKLWYRLVSDEYFIQLYNETSAKNPMLLVEVSDSLGSKSDLIVVDNRRGVSEFSLDFVRDRVKVRASCNGLLCCSSIPDKDVYYLCNPMTREFKLLPKSRERHVTRFYPDGEATLVGLACNLSTQKFNVVLAGYHRTFGHRSDGTFVCMIFDSESNKWRKFVSFHGDQFTHMNKNQVVFVNGALHWLTGSSCILTLNLEYDVWRKMSLPEQVTCVSGNRFYLLESDGCLSVIQISDAWMKIWVLKEYESEEWHLVDTVSLRCIKGLVPGIFPICQTGECVFLATHKQILVFFRKTRVWKEMYSVKNSSTLPLWYSAHAFRGTIFSLIPLCVSELQYVKVFYPMARKGNQQKNAVDRQTSKHRKKGSDSGCTLGETKGNGKASEVKVFPGEELPNGDQPSSPLSASASKTNHPEDENKNRQKSGKSLRKEKQGMDAGQGPEESSSLGSDLGDHNGNNEAPSRREENGTLPPSHLRRKHTKRKSGSSLNRWHMRTLMARLEFSDTLLFRNLKASALPLLKMASEWLQRHEPFFLTIKSKALYARDYVKTKFEQAYPFVLKWLMQFGSILFLLSMAWLDCTLRGFDSLVRMGTTSFFSVIWCSILSVVAMAGMFKFLIVLVFAALIGLFIGFMLSILVVSFCGALFLWFYGSFWTTGFIIFLGGLAFTLSHERIALSIATLYSIYCAWTSVGWLGLLLGLNLSFISSDYLIYFLKNNVSQQRRPNGSSEQTSGMPGQPDFFNSEQAHASSSGNGPWFSADRSPGVPSTSGTDSEITSEDEVVRLLNCTDHYSALGFSRYENVDVSLLKREYKKKAMLVHPDKNMGNEKAAEAFKKLQNAYEILLDSLKRKTYDDELRREELLDIFCRFQSASQKNGGHSVFPRGFPHPEADGEDPFGDSRRIACNKCGNLHVWVLTRKSKSQSRWCQDCKDFHQAKDGDGWVEQSSQPFFFGMLQKVHAPSAFICADSKIYNATEWYICQGMRCPANTHKPSFHVNTSVTSNKHNTGKGASSGQRGGRMPTSNMEENMTEEEFFEWLQNAVQTGMFENSGAGTSTESPSAKSGPGTKSGGSTSGSANKRKKKGKKW
ncbi:hypothetical protein PS2_011841 [Malus domestica]